MGYGRFKIIGFCSAKPQNEPQKHYINVINNFLEGSDWRLMTFSTFNDLFLKSDFTKGCAKVFDVINYDMLDVMMIYPKSIKDDSVTKSIIERCHQHNLPVIVWDALYEGCWSISFDEVGSFENIVRHVIEYHKCKVINVMAGMYDNEYSDRRIEIVRKVMAENGLTLDDIRINYGEFWDVPTKNEMERFFECGLPLPDAFICCNDTMAIAVCDVLEKHGVKVPQDTIVTGFDGIEYEQFCSPRLTTASYKIEGVREVLGEILERIEKNPEACDLTLIPCDIKYSESCGCEPINIKAVNSNFMGYIKHFDDLNNYVKYLGLMSTEITENTSLKEMSELIRRLMLEDTWIILNDDFCVFDENVIKNNIKKETNMLKLPETMQVYACRHSGRNFTEYDNFPQQDIAPDLNGIFDRNYTVAIVPIHFQNYIFGYLIKEHSEGRIDYEMLSCFEEKLEQFLETMRKQQKLNAVNHQLEKLYLLDPMIDIFNRRGFYQSIDKTLVENSYRYFSIISIDMDGLKHINDNYGHNEGDSAIKALGAILTACSGDNEICSRFGGDEFNVAIFCNDEPQRISTDFIVEVRERIKDYNAHSGKAYPLEISVGTAYSECNDNLNISEVLDIADTRMYEDKTKRNKARTN